MKQRQNIIPPTVERSSRPAGLIMVDQECMMSSGKLTMIGTSIGDRSLPASQSSALSAG